MATQRANAQTVADLDENASSLASRLQAFGLLPPVREVKDVDPVSAQLHGVHILVVDDNGDARTIFSKILNYAGASVLVAASAVTAARTLKHVRPSVVLTDLSMPRRDGLWLVRWIRSRDAKHGAHLPVIAVSARDDVYLEAETLATGFDEYLVKPVEPPELFAAIRRVTQRPLDSPRFTG
jgi:CheY-like chemotaxis protein